ncbi:hypothetical protein AGABI1DRAFT_128199 [Agaricus bisporus var. burnettii JB137-S8]|uniref:Uncharacterized protein n=1 Tax=Agaricus bisporus var. burnettii (strain JB137-S8 / ATCC MYA-4627 / FGSC 10392) TaxID=597362 RepID=K5XBN9_AGABU|nr:uncharacterized protein AGABI1DRAFT_128199 [Agaricus bisporus var. burnettii JB137-S8]EKM80522.1 hypothetical protein AGABI1DRAFT_128199 [Agaricus bisporus var. burnettii JB137-S8]
MSRSRGEFQTVSPIPATKLSSLVLMEQFHLSSVLANPSCPVSRQWSGDNVWDTIYTATEAMEHMKQSTVLIGEVDIGNSALGPTGDYEDSIIPLEAAIYRFVLEAPHHFGCSPIKRALHVSGASTLEPLIQDGDGRVCLVHEIFRRDEDLKHASHVSKMECDSSTYREDHLAVNGLLEQGYEIVAPSVSFAPTGQQVFVKDFSQAMRNSLVEVSFTISHRV